MSNYQVKVNNTQKYEDSQGSHVVTAGKLILIEGKPPTKEPHPLIKHEGKLYKNPSPKVTIKSSGIGIKPILISETEEIEAGDRVLYANSIYDVIRIDMHNRPIVMFEGEESQLATWGKILALPEHFFDKHLQAIVDGKMRDGGKVLVKCEYRRIEEKVSASKGNFIHLNQQNHITLFPAKQSLEEAANEFAKDGNSPTAAGNKRACQEQGFKAGAEWAKKNNY